jgi:hypothetical protein
MAPAAGFIGINIYDGASAHESGKVLHSQRSTQRD